MKRHEIISKIGEQYLSSNIENEEFSWYNNKKAEPFGNYLKVVTVSLAKNRECGKEWIFDKRANWYLSSTFYNENRVVDSFDGVKYKSGIAIIYTTKDRQQIRMLDRIFQNADWLQYSSLATNSCHHIGKSHIFCVNNVWVIGLEIFFYIFADDFATVFEVVHDDDFELIVHIFSYIYSIKFYKIFQ